MVRRHHLAASAAPTSLPAFSLTPGSTPLGISKLKLVTFGFKTSSLSRLFHAHSLLHNFVVILRPSQRSAVKVPSAGPSHGKVGELLPQRSQLLFQRLVT